ncbi:MAG TPA: mannosyltransferase family protein [Solirubrobacteraceae bacterium]|nr:mannosyltransferase family protein [Solirubrobacteraceae bacterium]
MNPDIANAAVSPPATLERRRPALLARLSADVRALDPARKTAARESWRALWRSRLLVWAAGVGTVLAFGYGPERKAFDPPGVTKGFGWLGDLLAAPAARWDSAWFLVIARHGYSPGLGTSTLARAAYFPAYPLGVRAISWFGAPPVLAGVLLSLGAFALALYGIHRLATLELGHRPADAISGARVADASRLAVTLMAFAPMAFFFSAVYSESLYMALSVGLFWSARHGRWGWVGVLGALAGATRSTGLVLIVPALVIYLYGPREDRPPDRAAGRAPAGLRRLLPRYRIGRELLWLALAPAGVVLYACYLGLAGGDPLAPLHAEEVWSRHLTSPFMGIWDGLRAAFDGARQLLSFQNRHVYFAAASGSPSVNAGHNLLDFGFLAAAVPAIVGVLRRLPLAYGAYALAALALPLSDPVRAEPLMSLPRFIVVLFPLGIWLGAWLAERPRLQRPALVLSGALMACFLAQFATWHWVA